jgi:hypothetical protein
MVFSFQLNFNMRAWSSSSSFSRNFWGLVVYILCCIYDVRLLGGKFKTCWWDSDVRESCASWETVYYVMYCALLLFFALTTMFGLPPAAFTLAALLLHAYCACGKSRNAIFDGWYCSFHCPQHTFLRTIPQKSQIHLMLHVDVVSCITLQFLWPC